MLNIVVLYENNKYGFTDIIQQLAHLICNAIKTIEDRLYYLNTHTYTQCINKSEHPSSSIH